MARVRTSIVKLSRSLGVALGKEHVVRRRSYPPGIHGPKMLKGRRLSAYGEQLREKQRAKAVYGLMERQFRNYFEKAKQHQGNTGELLVQSLELRLDNVVFRLGFSKTRRQARQIVSHGFIEVNGKKVDIPSFSTKVGDQITIKESKKETGLVKAIPEIMNQNPLPKWISRDDKTLSGKVTSIPEGEDLDQPFDPTLIVEFYSR